MSKTNSECSCQYDGLTAFGIPWLAVTTLGTVATYNQPDCAFILEAVVPGLLAGATGLLMYKLVKKTVKELKQIRRKPAALTMAMGH
jgi:mannose/fructose/N-acetylgalactosamine-specific phosphotransferase system component IID